MYELGLTITLYDSIAMDSGLVHYPDIVKQILGSIGSKCHRRNLKVKKYQK